MNETLLLIAIGPVQDFIASARKLRDLWFGSWCLSELSKSVAKTLYGEGSTLIFPAIGKDEAEQLDPESEFNVANKIMAVVASPEKAKELTQKAREAWMARLKDFADKVRNNSASVKIDWDLFDKQLADYGEFFSVWVDIDKAGGYGKARERAEQLMGARKNLREFKAPMWPGSGKKKNSLDGSRESVLKTPVEVKGLLKSGELLDAMGCIKRFSNLGRNRKKFYDLSDMALRPWLEGMSRDENRRDAYEKFVGVVSPLVNTNDRERLPASSVDHLVVTTPSHLFFLQKKALMEELEVEATLMGKIWPARMTMVTNGNSPDKSPYAAILVGDGDHMGTMIDTITTQEGHVKFAKQLSGFAVRSEGIVQSHGGGLVYAGGDDVMAYLPLNTVVACADELRTTFYEIMKDVHEELGLDKAVSIPTFSVGIALVHHKAPLDRAIELARTAEKQAKNEGGRNALAIIRSKRSGADISVHGKFDSVNGLLGIAERLNNIIDYFNGPDAVLPSRLGYQLREATRLSYDELSFTVEEGGVVPNNAISALVKRIFDQKNGQDNDLNQQIHGLLAGRTSLRQLSDELVIGLQLAEATKVAEGKEAK